MNKAFDDLNIIPKYEVGEKKLCNHSYKLQFIDMPGLTLNLDTYCLQTSTNIKLTLARDEQHDGHCWNEHWSNQNDARLVDEIMFDIRQKVVEFVTQVNPYACHKESPKGLA